jgi:hypothetical protein
MAQIGPPIPPPGGGGGPITAIPGPDGTLQQTDSQGNSLPVGAIVTDGVVQFTCVAPQYTNQLELHVEILQTYQETFNNDATVTSLPVSQNQTAVASFTFPDIFPLKFHWQAWWKDVITGEISIKVSFGNNPEVDPDVQTGNNGPGGLIYRETFLTEGFPQGWTFAITLPTPVVWRADGTPASIPGGVAKSVPFSLNYNDGTDYYDGNANNGWAQSPGIDLSGTNNPKLTFWCNYQTDTTGVLTDQRIVSVHDDISGYEWTSAQLSTVLGGCDQMGTWHEHTLVLNEAWGPVVLRFLFDTIDSWNNQHGGWFVDDIEIRETAPLEIDPASLQQLDTAGNPVPVGDVIDDGLVTFAGSVKTGNGNPLRLEIELRRVGVPFSGSPTHFGDLVSGTQDLQFTLAGLDDEWYRWQARLVDANGSVSAWVDFGSNPLSDRDFIWVSVQAAPEEDDDEHRKPSISCWGSIPAGHSQGYIFLLFWGFALLLATRIRQS